MAQCITQLLVPTSIQNSQTQLSETGVLYWLLHDKFVENKLTVDNTTYHVLKEQHDTWFEGFRKLADALYRHDLDRKGESHNYAYAFFDECMDCL